MLGYLRQQAHEGQVQGVQGNGLEQDLVGAVGFEHLRSRGVIVGGGKGVEARWGPVRDEVRGKWWVPRGPWRRGTDRG